MNKPTVPNEATQAAVSAVLNSVPAEDSPAPITPAPSSSEDGHNDSDSSTGSEDSFWETFAEDTEVEEVGEEVQPEPQVVPKAVEPVAPTAVEPVAPVTPSEPTPPVQAVESQVTPQTAAPVETIVGQETVSYPTPEQIAEGRNKALEAITASYSISEEEAEQLTLEPDKVFPKLAARIQLNTFDAVMQVMNQLLPQAVERITAESATRKGFNREFYEKWKQLENHKDVVAQVAKVYSAVRSGATREQALQEIGMQACTVLGLPFTGVPERTVESSATPRPAPATPARAPSQSSSNPWADIAEEFLAEDREE